jgi:NTE family protein
MKPRIKIAIVCQGGGSQTAFTAGALKTLCEAEIHDHFEVVTISGTSGGAVCAARVWFAFEKDERPLWRWPIDFSQDNAAQGWLEQAFNLFVVGSLQMANIGLLPTLQLSPSSPLVQSASRVAMLDHRENFWNFRSLLETHLDFDEIASWGPRAKHPVLKIGATNVITGRLTKFISIRESIRIERILASCAVPSVFPAAQIGGDGDWDGLFSDNPSLQELVRPGTIGDENPPGRIWLIKINPTAWKEVPELPDDIVVRRNQLEGNISLFQQLRHLEMLNDLPLGNAFRPEYLAQFDIKSSIRIPRSFSEDGDKPYYFPCIEMAAELRDRLDYESKLDRSPANIGQLIAAGEASAHGFLQERAAAVSGRAQRGRSSRGTNLHA